MLTKGMASLIPPGVPHRRKSEKEYRQFVINLASDAQDDGLIKILTTHVSTPVVMNAPDLLGFLPEIEDCTQLQTLISIQKIRNRLEYMLLSCVEILIKQDGGQPMFKEKLVEFLRTNISEILTLDDISKVLFMSSSHIERLAYREFGCGAIRLFHRIKMDYAQLLLRTTNLPISNISSCLGYMDQGYFSRLFKKHVGITPLNYKTARNSVS